MMRTVKLRVVAILTIVMTLGIALAGSASAASPLDKLKDAQERLEEIQDRLDEVSATCDRNEQRVADVNDRVKTTVQAVTEAEVAVGRQQRIVDEAGQHLSELEAEASSVQDMSNGRVIELYKQGIADPTLSSLLASVSAEEVLSRAQVLNVVKHGDKEAIERLLSSQTAVDGQRKLYEEQQRSFEEALTGREQIVKELEELKKTYDKKVARCNKQVVKLEHQEQVASSDEQALASELAAQGVINVPPGVTEGGWTWPTRGTVTSPFGYRWGRLHAGIDIGAPIGAPMYAARGGVVSFSGVMGGYGNISVIDHGDGMTTRYAHQSELIAGVGQTVHVGDQIGKVGNTGSSTGPHAHFEVRINDQPQDPMAYLP